MSSPRVNHRNKWKETVANVSLLFSLRYITGKFITEILFLFGIEQFKIARIDNKRFLPSIFHKSSSAVVTGIDFQCLITGTVLHFGN